VIIDFDIPGDSGLFMPDRARLHEAEDKHRSRIFLEEDPEADH